MSTEQRVARLESALGTSGKPPTFVMVIVNHPDLPTDPEEREAYIRSRIPESVRAVFHISDNGRNPADLLLRGPVRLL